MKKRVGGLIGEGRAEGMPWLGTFHSIGVKILRRHAEMVGLRADFTILDTDDQVRLLKQIITAANIDEKRWPARQLAGGDRRLEEPRADARQGAERRGLCLCERQGPRALRRISAAAEDAERRRLRRPAARMPAALPRAAGRARRFPVALPLHAGRRIPGHQRRAVSLAAAARAGEQEHLLRRRRRPVDLRLARRGGRQHPSLRARFSRRDRDPAGAELSLDRPHPRRRLGADRPQRGAARKNALHRHGGDGREGRGRLRLGFFGGSARDRRRHRADAAAKAIR